MIEEYLFKTIISFISLKCVFYITKDNWLKLNPKKNSFVKRNINQLVFCLIPIIRWIWIILVLIIGLALSDDKFVEKCKKQKEDK